MAQLYGKCFDINNINSAIETIYNKKNITPDTIKRTKQILRRCSKLDNKFYNNIAHQCIYQIIQPIINTKASNNSYQYKDNINIKIPISKICSKIFNSEHNYIIKFNFTDYFKKNINIDMLLDALRTTGVTDGKVLATIKYLLYTNDWYNTLLGQVLINNYLSIIDIYINNHTDDISKNFVSDFARHKDNYISWLQQRKRKPGCKYYRYGMEAIILTNSRVEQLNILSSVTNFIQLTFNNDVSIKCDYNHCTFGDYKIIKRKEYGIPKIGITPNNPKKIYNAIKLSKWKTPKEIANSLQIIINLFIKYDICNDMSFYLNRLGLRLLKIAKRQNSVLKKVPNKVQYTYTYKNQTYIIDIYELRKTLRVSFKEYLLNSIWLLNRDKLNNLTIFMHGHQLYRWSLWTRQKGKDKITNHILNPKCIHIHHINGNHVDNRLQNLILVDNKIHKLIHNNTKTDNVNIIKYRKYLQKQNKSN